MLLISNIDEFKDLIKSKDEIKEMQLSDNCISFCYVISNEDTFNNNATLECRGIVFDADTKKVISRPLHKFFNVGEKESTLPNNIDWTKVTAVFDKRDGSMIHTVDTINGIKLKSKKSFTSDVALVATEWLKSDAGKNTVNLVNYVCENNCTAIFEWTSPISRIVVYYPESKLTLLHVRDNSTGQYYTYEQLKNLSEKFNVSLVDKINTFSVDGEFNFELMQQAAETATDIEGWIIQFSNGDMVKLKTKWYLNLHHSMTFLRERDIAQLVLDEQIDDLKSLLTSEGVDIQQIIPIENKVSHQLSSIMHEVEQIVSENKHLSRKDFAINFSKHSLFPLLMKAYLNEYVAVKEYFEKYILKQQYSLIQLNLGQTTLEEE